MVTDPVKPAPNQAIGSLAFYNARTAKPRRILIVEDNLDSVRALAALVQDMGHEVSYAINGWAALEIASKFAPEFVVLDIGLPGMDGYELCRLLKKEPGLSKARIIALTAYSSDEHRKRSLEAGCELHLVKPVRAQTLFDLFESTLKAQ